MTAKANWHIVADIVHDCPGLRSVGLEREPYHVGASLTVELFGPRQRASLIISTHNVEVELSLAERHVFDVRTFAGVNDLRALCEYIAE